jgi:hypothetical protein
MNENLFPTKNHIPGQQVVSNNTAPLKEQQEQTLRELPMSVRIIASLAQSFLNLAWAGLIITQTVGILIGTYLLVSGYISTDIYLKLIQFFLNCLQNLVIG